MTANFNLTPPSHNEPILNNLPTAWFDAEITYQQICYCFNSGKREIRIACGFFSVKGWGRIRRYTIGKRVYLLVGIDEPGKEQARAALVKEILRDLATGTEQNRRETVQDLVEKMESEELRVFDARAMKHHAKLYLVDENIAISGSANTTNRGFIEQIESGTLYGPSLIEKFVQTQTAGLDKTEVAVMVEALTRFFQEEVKTLVKKFNRYFTQSVDLTQELLEAFRKWLKMARPWDIYLKTMLVLENLQPLKSSYSKQPATYQLDMIEQGLRQLLEYAGSMMVGSTGLGKTIVAVHIAIRLRDLGEIDNVMVIGPKALRHIWKRELRDAGLPCEYFVSQALDREDSSQDKSLEEFEEIVRTVSENRWLLIVDESHEFRNRFVDRLSNRRYRESQSIERRSFTRLKEFTHQHNVKVLLSTGSPYAKDIDNINNQLYLLPAFNQEVLESANTQRWLINDITEFRNLDVSLLLTTPHVAKHYGQRDEQNNIYTMRGQEKIYIPNVRLNTLYIPVILEPELVPLIAAGYFELDSRDPMHRMSIQSQVMGDWTSSPWALRQTIKRVIDTPGGSNAYNMEKLEFRFLREDRQQVLVPILELLNQHLFNNDPKIQALWKILATHRARNEKIAIYTKRLPTAAYLEKAIKKFMPKLRVGNTTVRKEAGVYKMKKNEEIQELIKTFAPIANNAVVNKEDEYDIFISTDAFGVGVNLQDASVLINYDFDWTPISPVQRAGRILRPWFEPRTIEIYTFVPVLVDEINSAWELPGIERKWQKLMGRHDESQKMIDLPVLTMDETQEIYLPDMASPVTIQMKSGQLDLAALADEEISPFFQHKAKLQSNREYAKNISSDITSARAYSGNDPLIFMLFSYEDKYDWLLYNCNTQKLSKPDIVYIFNLIACDEHTETALPDFNQVEELSVTCLQAWCDNSGIIPENVTRECTLYLKPDSEADTFKNWLTPNSVESTT